MLFGTDSKAFLSISDSITVQSAFISGIFGCTAEHVCWTCCFHLLPYLLLLPYQLKSQSQENVNVPDICSDCGLPRR